MSIYLRPQSCLACTRLLRPILVSIPNSTPQHAISPNPSFQIVRQKHKLPRSETITVRLLRNVPRFGRKGSYVPVSAGQMRNFWFPRRTAAYIVDPTTKKGISSGSIAVLRDYDFLVDEEVAANGGKDGAKRDAGRNGQAVAERLSVRFLYCIHFKQQTNVMQPQRSIELISVLVPARLDFYRQVIETSTPTSTEETLSDSQTLTSNGTLTSSTAPESASETTTQTNTTRTRPNAASDLANARRFAATERRNQQSVNTQNSTQQTKSIFGSVTKAAILSSIKALLAENHEASKVAISEDDLRLVNVRDESGTVQHDADRIKTLGEFTLEIGFKGVDRIVSKNVRVLPQDSA